VDCVCCCLYDLLVAHEFPHWGLITFSNLNLFARVLSKYNLKCSSPTLILREFVEKQQKVHEVSEQKQPQVYPIIVSKYVQWFPVDTTY